MFKYKVNTIGLMMVDWQSIQEELFGGATTVWAEFGGPVGEFHFETQPLVKDLGPLIKVTVLD
jgi:hypothetical protein